MKTLLRVSIGCLSISLLVVSASTPRANAGEATEGGCSAAGSIVTCGAEVQGTEANPSGVDSSGPVASSPTQDDATAAAASPPPPPPCVYQRFPLQGPPPPGANPDGQWDAVYCAGLLFISGGVTASGQPSPAAIWVPLGQSPPAVTPATPPSGAVLAQQAIGELALPAPTLGMSPAGTGYVNLPEWLWVDPAIWHPYSVTVSASNALGTTSVTATATPVDVVWDTGDGAAPTVCDGPGTAYDEAEPPTAQSTACAHTYTVSSLGQPSADGDPNDAAFTVTATVEWQVAWAGTDGSSGTSTLTTAAAAALRVEQIEAVTCDTTCPPS